MEEWGQPRSPGLSSSRSKGRRSLGREEERPWERGWFSGCCRLHYRVVRTPDRTGLVCAFRFSHENNFAIGGVKI